MNITPQEQQLIEAECSRLIAGYAYHVDRREYEELANLFAEDGVLDRGGNITSGRDSILAAMHERDKKVATRHMNGTPFFTSVTPTEARAVTYMLMYLVEGTDEGPNEVPGTTGLGEFHDHFKLTEDGWRISERIAKPAMIVKR